MTALPDGLDLAEQGELTARDWDDLIDGESEPFGPIGAGLEWRPKERHVTVRRAGRLVAAAGAVVATARVAGERLEVAGLGSLMVTRSLRGQGLLPALAGRILAIAHELGPARAMLFCRPELVALYRRYEFAEIAAPVWVDQPGGRIEMPEPAMWRPLHAGATWPAGRVDVDGLPF